MKTTHAPEMPHQELVEQAVQLSPQVLATVCEESRLLQVRYSLGQLAACTGSSELIAIAVQDIEDPHDKAIAHAKVGNIRRQESDAAQALAELQKLTDYKNVRRAPEAHELVELYTHFPDSTVLRGAAQHVGTGHVRKEYLLAALTGVTDPQERATKRQELEDLAFKSRYESVFIDYRKNFHPEFLSFAARAVIGQISAVTDAKEETTSKFFEKLLHIRDELIEAGKLQEVEQFIHASVVRIDQVLHGFDVPKQDPVCIRKIVDQSVYELRHAPSRYSTIVPVKEALQIQHPVDKEVTLTDTYNRLARIEHQKRIGTAVTPLPEGTVIEAFTKPPTKQLKQQGKRRLFSFGG